MEAAGTEPPPQPALNPSRDGYALTADGNIIHVRGNMLYRITEPGIRYVFNFLSASNIAQNIFNNALLYAAANYRVDDILTRDVAGFRDKVRSRVEQLVEQEQLGITVDQINVQAIPPRQVGQILRPCSRPRSAAAPRSTTPGSTKTKPPAKPKARRRPASMPGKQSEICS